ncbi:hypothetical protein [Thermococcus sp. 21S7]|uniref:hypothetical protein n=1 Tax=Thermococcus sp. 21S7 TaxID=1638221 RepID=UPI001439E783|nr:hypothetical protein [Thermococcus sp. 21S7]NJE62348.1 hypothetical protein [Thermococcus sp. 21S7]
MLSMRVGMLLFGMGLILFGILVLLAGYTSIGLFSGIVGLTIMFLEAIVGEGENGETPED